MADCVESDRSSASDSIWYVLATVAGEPTSVGDVNSIGQQNRYYWNGLMAHRIAMYGGSIEMSLGHDVTCPTLTDDEHRTIRRALDARGFRGVSIPHVNSPVDFSNKEFDGLVCFTGFVFGGEVRFNNARFSGGTVLFNDATFAGSVTFDGAEFQRDAVFMSAEFASVTSFQGTKFFVPTFFSSAKFFHNTSFAESKFLHDVYFNSVMFQRQVRFSQVLFAREADFRSAEFTGPTHFDGTNFETLVPGFFEATLYEYTDWHDSKWPMVPSDPDASRRQVQYYQRLGLLMNRLEKRSEQHFFFRTEMRAQRQAEGWTIAGLMNWLYEFICDYGYGLHRVGSLWVGHIGIGAVAMSAARIFGSPEDCSSWSKAHDFISFLPEALWISFSNAHALLGLNKGFLQEAIKSWSDTPMFNAIGSIQTALGVVLLFFLLLTIRNRFRMR